MKKLSILFAALMCSAATFAQVKISTSGGTPDASSVLDVESSNKGFLLPRVADPYAIVSPAPGLQVYNTITNCINIYNGTTWLEICGTVPVGTIATLDCAGATHNGSLSAELPASGVNSVLSYTGGNSLSHSGQTVMSTGVTGLTATLAAGNFAIGAGTLTYTITGTPSAAGTASFALNIGGKSCSLTRNVGAFPCGTAIINFTYKGAAASYGTVLSQGRCWLDRNLGAAQVATSITDANGYGDLFQWGRRDDGHQSRTSGTTSTLSSADQVPAPNTDKYIMASSGNFDWRSPQNNNLWQGVSGANNPCPSGWRIPTETEMDTERLSWSSNNAAGAFASALKLPLAGYRFYTTGAVLGEGTDSMVWTSTVSTSNPVSARRIYLGSGSANLGNDYRSLAFSVRCLKN